MGKKKRTTAQAKLPRNTVTFDLNGPDAEVLASFRAAQAHLRYWMFCQSPFRVRVGNNILYTTPTSGTFYYAMTYQDTYVVFVIIARTFWLVGFYNKHGFFQMLWEENRLYMDGPDTLLTGFDGNHSRISDADIEKTKLGTHWVRKGLAGIADYRGPTQRPEPEDFRSGIGRIVTMIMESKYGDIFMRCCGSISGDYPENRLGGGGASYLVHHWNSKSEYALSHVDQGHETAADIEETVEILNELSILQLDAYNDGIFRHDPLPPLPREETWEPIDNGTGDNRIGRPQTRGRFGAPQASHRNAVRKSQQDVQKNRAGLRGGGAGGEAAAPSWFADWSLGQDDMKGCDLVVVEARAIGLKILEAKLFVKDKVQNENTTSNDVKGSEEDRNKSKAPPRINNNGKDDVGEQDKNQRNAPSGSSSNGNEGEQDKNQRKAPPGSGDNVTDADKNQSKASSGSRNDGNESEEKAKNPHIGSTKKKYKEKTENPPISSGSKTSAHKGPLEYDIEELRGPSFVSDRNINRFIHNLSESFGSDGRIRFVTTDATHLLAHGLAGPDAYLGFDLNSPMITLFPVNNNENHGFGEGEGTHWSLLVLDTTGNRPRILHHDSLGGANTPAANRLANAIRRVVPHTEVLVEAPTPLQGNGWDCGIFVMAMARSIARWSANGDRGDWMERLQIEVNSSSVATLRLQLVEMLLGNMTFADLEEV